MPKTESGALSHQIDYYQADQIPTFTLNGSGVGPGNVRDPLSVLNTIPGATQSTDLSLVINGMPSILSRSGSKDRTRRTACGANGTKVRSRA